MKSLADKILKHVRVQDLVLVAVCVLSIYLLRARDSLILQPTWRHHIDPTAFANGRYPTQDEWLVRPLITDLDGDDVVEIIMVSSRNELLVCKVPVQNESDRRLPDLVILHSVNISSSGDEHPKHVVALESGYLIQATVDIPVRTQVIVVVLDDWTVSCYDHELNLKWSRTPMEQKKPRNHYMVKAMGVLISPYSLQKGDNGSVIVGGSYGHRDHDSRLKSLQNDGKSPHGSHSDSSHHVNSDSTDDIYTHFSTFAMSGVNGSIRWHHLPGDFEQNNNSVDDKTALHWKLSLKRGRWHVGEQHWSKYSKNIVKHMPHTWRNIRDTRFDVSDLRKVGVASNEKHSIEDYALLKDLIDLDQEHVIGLQYGGMKPHSRHEHVKYPNAVVIHNHKGIEVLSIDTGRPLTHLELQSHGQPSTFVDVNEDGTIEAVTANFALKCQAEVSMIQPRPKALFSGPLCESPFWWGGVSVTNLFHTADSISEDTHVAVTPVVVKSVARKRGMLNHLLGRGLLSEHKGYDSIFLTSTGGLTSYGPSGNPNWKVQLPASWSNIAFKFETESDFQSTFRGDIFLGSFQPSLKSFSQQIYGKHDAVLASGWDTIAVVDLKDGFIMSHHSLPCQPIDQPITADFNKDGWTDFVISCPDAFIGFEVRKGSSALYMFIVALTVVLTVALLVWCFGREEED